MSKNKDKNPKDIDKKEQIRGAVGGQAVIEGVMMKAKDSIAIAVRRENGEIVKKLKPYKSIRDKHKILNIPIIRGFINFIEMMAMSMSTLNESADMLGLNESIEKQAEEMTNKIFNEPPEETAKNETPAEKPKDESDKTDTSKLMLIASIIGTVLGLALSFGLFFFLPTFISSRIKIALPQIADMGWVISIMEGVIRLVIFIAYILLVSLLKDIRRTFEYHGAEHMSVFCYEAEEELTVENVKKYSRLHPRCGTSFLIVMMIIGIVISSFIPNFANFGFSETAAMWLRLLVKLSVFPVIIGIGYEFIKFAGKHDNIFVKIVSAPGIWFQLLTTKKPDDSQLEVAIVSLRTALKIDPVEIDVGRGIPDAPPQSPVVGNADATPFQKGASENDPQDNANAE